MPRWPAVEISEVHIFTARDVEAESEIDAVRAAKALWNERRKRGIPDDIPEKGVRWIGLPVPTDQEGADTKPITDDEDTKPLKRRTTDVITKDLWRGQA